MRVCAVAGKTGGGTEGGGKVGSKHPTLVPLFPLFPQVRLAATHELVNTILTPIQVARALVAAFPRPPDGLATALWVAAGEGDVDAAATLASYGGRPPVPGLPSVGSDSCGPPPVTTGYEEA